jgi:hypothetical protein
MLVAAILAAAIGAGRIQESAPSRWVLVYSGGSNRSQYSINNLLDLIAIIDTSGRAVGPLCDGVILTEFRAVSGRYYMPWPNGQPSEGVDWEVYLDSLTAPTGILTRLDAAAGTLGRAAKVSVTVMVPYPDATRRSFSFSGREYDLSDNLQRGEVLEAYLREVVDRVTSRELSHLSFYGFYWLNESIEPFDSSLVTRATGTARSMGYRFLWIPAYGAAGAAKWRAFGFNEAWQQPNYFFHPDITRARLDSAVRRARAADMGLEVEFDRRLFSDSLFHDRLGPYLDALETAPDLRNRSISIYEGAGALMQLSRSADARYRALYNRLVTLLRPSVRP